LAPGVDDMILGNFDNLLLYKNIDQKLRNKLHGTMHYKTGVTCVFNEHKLYILCCNNMTV